MILSLFDLFREAKMTFVKEVLMFKQWIMKRVEVRVVERFYSEICLFWKSIFCQIP